MSTLIIFIIVALLFAITLAVFILLPWLQTQDHHAIANRADNQLLTLNIEVFKQRLVELDADFGEGEIDEATYQTQKLALERQLLDISDNQDTSHFTPNWKSRLIVIIWIPLLSAMAYVMIADRTPVYQLWDAQNRLGKVADDLLTAKIDTPPEWATKDSVGLISAMQTNVHHHATDPLRWFRLSEVFVALQAPEQAIEALARAYRLNPDDEKVAITYAQTSFFTLNVQDKEGNFGIDLGLTGVPESFVVDGKGNVRQHILGEINEERYNKQVLPCMTALREQAADAKIREVCQ
jgi:cytochrome c-type biogenesis protein CcmH